MIKFGLLLLRVSIRSNRVIDFCMKVAHRNRYRCIIRAFRRIYGAWRFLVRWKILFGELAGRLALPTKANLFRRKITTEALCENCNVRNEDCSHAIFFCTEVQAAWLSDPQWSWLSTMDGRPVMDIFKYAFSEKKDLPFYRSWARQSRIVKTKFGLRKLRVL